MGERAGLWIDGEHVPTGGLSLLPLLGGGHYTTMQVRDGCVRGLDAHLRRVDAAHRELYGHALDLGELQDRWARATHEARRCTLRSIHYDAPDGQTHVVVELLSPTTLPADPVRLRSVAYARPVAHVKHVGTFGQVRHRLAAVGAGYDDALLVTAAGEVAETTVADIAFLRAGEVTWPTAPALHGVGRRLLRPMLARAGVAQRETAVALADVGSYDAAYLVSSTGVVPVERIDGHGYPDPGRAVAPVAVAYDGIGWDRLER